MSLRPEKASLAVIVLSVIVLLLVGATLAQISALAGQISATREEIGKLSDTVSKLAETTETMSRLLENLTGVITKPPPPKPPVAAVALVTPGWWKPPPAGNYNPWAPMNIFISGIVYERLAYWIRKPGFYKPILAEKWEITPTKVTVYLRKNAYWHDGTHFTSKDVWTTFMIGKAFGWTVWLYLDRVEIPDDYTVVFYIKKPGVLVPRYILTTFIHSPYHRYGKWAEKVAKAKTSEELNKIREEVIAYRPDTLVGTGPFKMKSITEAEIVFEKFEKHWAAEKIVIPEIKFPLIYAREVAWAEAYAGRIDYAFWIPTALHETVRKEKPWIRIVYTSDLAGPALFFNLKHKWLKDLRVRKAIAYLVDREAACKAAAVILPHGPAVIPTGILNEVVDEWITPEFKAKLDPYNYDPKKAEALLKEVGFTKKEGKWYTPDGELFRLTLIAPGGWDDWMAVAEYIASSLRDFGIEVDYKTPEVSLYWAKLVPGGEFDMCIGWWGRWYFFPLESFRGILVVAKPGAHPWAAYPWVGMPEVIELPEIGRVNVTELLITLETTFEKEKQIELVQKLAYIVNQYLPAVPIGEKLSPWTCQELRFRFPPDDDYTWWLCPGDHLGALAIMILEGKVVPIPKE